MVPILMCYEDEMDALNGNTRPISNGKLQNNARSVFGGVLQWGIILNMHLNYLQWLCKIFRTKITLMFYRRYIIHTSVNEHSDVRWHLAGAFYPKQLKIHWRNNPLWSNLKLSAVLKDKMGRNRSCNFSILFTIKHPLPQRFST